MDNGIAIAVGAFVGSEALGITNISGMSDSNNSGGDNQGISAFAGQIGNQLTGFQNSLTQMQNNFQNFQNAAVTGTELANALSGIDTGPTMGEIGALMQTQSSGLNTGDIERLFEKFSTENGNPEDSSDSRNQDNGGTNNAGNTTTVTEFESRVNELQLERAEFELEQEKAENYDLRNSNNGIVAGTAELGVEMGDFYSDATQEAGNFANWVNTNPITELSNEGMNDVSQLVSSGTVEKSEGEKHSLVGDILSSGPKYQGPDPFNLGGNKEKDERDTQTSTNIATNTTESGGESQNEKEERNTVGNRISGFAVR